MTPVFGFTSVAEVVKNKAALTKGVSVMNSTGRLQAKRKKRSVVHHLEQRLHSGSITVEVIAVKVDRRVRLGHARCSRAVREPVRRCGDSGKRGGRRSSRSATKNPTTG